MPLTLCYKMRWTQIIFTFLFSIICFTASGQYKRFDDITVITYGKNLYRTNCASCHGENAEGTVIEWQKPSENGMYPPPPLNGTAHTWHHSINALAQVIRNGTISRGGSMPAWGEQLNDNDIFAIIMHLSSLWSDEIYQTWMQANLR